MSAIGQERTASANTWGATYFAAQCHNHSVPYLVVSLMKAAPFCSILISCLLITGVAHAAPSIVTRLQAISGDRQILVNTQTPPKPFVVRGFDVAGNPVNGAPIFIGTGADTGYPHLFDEFIFRGFNTGGLVEYDYPPPPQLVAVTDASGVASLQPPLVDFPTSSSIVGAGQVNVTYPGNSGPWFAFFAAVMVKATPPGNPAVVIEYFYPALQHYFITLDDAEIAALNAGQFAGWTRSTGSFIAYRTKADAPPDAVPVCRFFSSQFTSHFYTANAQECDDVIARYPDVWTLETREAFFISVPDATGNCAPGFQPVYRMFNNTESPNHRYITDRSLRTHMAGRGWIAEGYGVDAVMMCTPA